jgi:putative sigma-54 modulation protein
MRLQVKGKNYNVSPELRQYAEEKLGKLERHLHDLTQIELELAVEKNPSIHDGQVAEATVWTKGPVLRARESSPDMHASIDQLVEKLTRQAQRYRDKRTTEPRRHVPHPEDAVAPPREEPEAAFEPEIVKTKRFPVKPMSAEEAALQLELIGHVFFVFRNADSGEVNVAYRRRDGDVGLIEPE